MNLHLSLSPLLYSSITLFFIFIFTLFHTSFGVDYDECERRYSCGNISVGYPFWGDTRPEHCGHPGFNLTCEGEEHSFIEMEGLRFRVLEINETLLTMWIARMDIWENPCSHDGFGDTSLDYRFFDFVDHANQNLTLWYGCDGSPTPIPPIFNCSINGQVNSNNYYLSDNLLGKFGGFDECNKNSIKVPILNSSVDQLFSRGPSFLQQALNGGFDVTYSSIGIMCQYCTDDGRLCAYDSGFRCMSKPGSKLSRSRKLVIGIGAGVGIIVITCTAYYFWLGRRVSLEITDGPLEEIRGDLNVEAFLQHYGSLAPKRYSYSEVKKMTNSFKEKLGQGGYGAVYKGNLLNGYLVAVKVLNSSKRNGEEFINEVASISRTSHVNVVTLLGFCLQGHRRALIYEFMPNGSLEKFVYSDKTLQANQQLGWEKLYQIATGIARGLEYLHRGCNTKILHFDIKPHNILLDEDFCPKISDFGLAKLCTAKESKISMLEARGTIGYIAPEVFSRQFGRVSHKSDVYSYGMLLIEMVGGRKNLDIGVNHSSEIYFPHWLYKRLEVDAEFQLHGGMTAEELEIAKKMIMVGLWCIQTIPSKRPSMSKVIEMFERSIGDLEIPPRPFLSSPPRSPPPESSMSESSATLTSTS